jgi:hypothetical protein
MDINMKVRTAKNDKQYTANPNRYDILRLDNLGSEFNVDWS